MATSTRAAAGHSSRPATSTSAPADRAADPSRSRLRRHLPWLDRLESPVTTYYLLVGVTVLLTVIGLVMVLSASAVTSYKNTGSSLTVFKSQLLFAAIGLPVMLVASRLPVRFWQRIGWFAMIGTILLQLLVFTPLGVTVNGNRNWIEITGQRLQPSEFAKVALILWAASVLASKRRLLGQWKHVVVPVVFPAGLLVLALVMAGHDLGTGLVLLTILGALLFVAGAPTRLFAIAAAVGAAGVAALVLTSGNRMGRISIWLAGECSAEQRLGACLQPIHGKYALADGGWWGVGLGASREKWSWLPEAHNDFIFAIIGEELGLPGTFVVLALFALLGYACYRLVGRSPDPFVRIASAGIMAWVLGQALINIGAVIGMLPVIGVPLPLVSSGGSALVTTLLALGVLLSFARAEPGAKEALAARPHLLRRSLAVLPGARSRASRGGRR